MRSGSGEYEGEGAMRIYTWPVRFLLIATSALAALAYVTTMITDLRNGVHPQSSTGRT